MSRYNFTEEQLEFIESNPAIFKGHGKLNAKQRENLYLIYNQVFNDSRRPTGCGACQRNVVNGLYTAYKKYKGI